ncbi:MAG: VOC family protein [Bacteroidia bacterium]
MIKFAYTILYVENVTASIEFYEKAFGFKRKFIADTNEYGELLTGETTLSFASTKLAKTNLSKGFLESQVEEKPFAMEIAFTTDNVQHTIDVAIKAGAILVESPKTKPWGQTVAYLKDPGGFLIEVCTPMN